MFRFSATLVFVWWILAANAAEPLANQQLVTELRKGGYVLYIRHTSTDFSRNDAKMTSYDTLRNLLATPPAKGRNTVISSHGNPFHAVFGPPYLAEGEIAVVQPAGKSGFTRIGRIRLEDWPLRQ